MDTCNGGITVSLSHFSTTFLRKTMNVKKKKDLSREVSKKKIIIIIIIIIMSVEYSYVPRAKLFLRRENQQWEERQISWVSEV